MVIMSKTPFTCSVVARLCPQHARFTKPITPLSKSAWQAFEQERPAHVAAILRQLCGASASTSRADGMAAARQCAFTAVATPHVVAQLVAPFVVPSVAPRVEEQTPSHRAQSRRATSRQALS